MDTFTVMVLIGVVYFLPCLIGLSRDIDRGAGGVVLVNLFLGWTLIGWLVALIWAVTGETSKESRLRKKALEQTIAPTGSLATELAAVSAARESGALTAAEAKTETQRIRTRHGLAAVPDQDGEGPRS